MAGDELLIRCAIPLLPLLVLAACGNAPIHYYSLAPVPSAGLLAHGHALKPPIEVGDVPVPPIVDRNGVVVSAGDDRLDVSAEDQWGAPLGQLIQQALTEDLTSRLPPGSVLQPGTVAPPSGVRVLTLDISDFVGDTDGHVTLAADWALVVGGTSTVIRRGHVRIHTQAASGNVDAIVPAMSQALGRLADHLALRLVAR